MKKNLVFLVLVMIIAFSIIHSHAYAFYNVALIWDDVFPIEKNFHCRGYRVYQQIENEIFQLVWDGKETTEAIIYDLEENVHYNFIIRAYNDGRESEDSSILSVIKETSLPPVAEAGENQTVYEFDVVALNGSASTGSIIDYFWEEDKNNKYFVSMSDWHLLNPTFEAPATTEPVNLIFYLTVTSWNLLQDTDTITITVNPKQVSVPGDINGDGVKDTADRSIIILHRGHPVEECPLCDINTDGQINNTDLILWYRL